MQRKSNDVSCHCVHGPECVFWEDWLGLFTCARVTSASVCCCGSSLCLLIIQHCASLYCVSLSLFDSISSLQTTELQRHPSRLLEAWPKHSLSLSLSVLWFVWRLNRLIRRSVSKWVSVLVRWCRNRHKMTCIRSTFSLKLGKMRLVWFNLENSNCGSHGAGKCENCKPLF